MVRATAGKGANGIAAFDRSKTQIKGKPSGGNGGGGGSIIFRLDPSKNSLHHVPKRIFAENGQPGGKANMEGASGADFVLGLPPGTVVRELLEDEEKLQTANARLRYRMSLVDPIDGGNALRHLENRIHQTEFEMSAEVPERIVCVGGRGGKGNLSFGKNNHECEKGHPGQARIFELDLNTIADFGLVGLPNAGKSSFLSAVSNAHPKIAPYPFTTLNPYVGTIQFPDYSSITVADIPGLIEGAHRNIGLGHKFLKHVVKSRALAYVVDFSRPDPYEDYEVVARELDLYKPGLSRRCRLIIANKIDLLEDPKHVIESVKERLDESIEIIPISAKMGIGIKDVTTYMKSIIDSTITTTTLKN